LLISKRPLIFSIFLALVPLEFSTYLILSPNPFLSNATYKGTFVLIWPSSSLQSWIYYSLFAGERLETSHLLEGKLPIFLNGCHIKNVLWNCLLLLC